MLLYNPALPSTHLPFVPQLVPHPSLYIPPCLHGTTGGGGLGAGGGGALEDGGGALDDGGGAAALERAAVEPSLVSMICQTAAFPVPSFVVILPPYFISGVPLVGGHPFSTDPSALKHVEELAT